MSLDQKESKTTRYKDIQVPVEMVPLIPHMPEVETHRETLTNLGSQWDLLTMLGQMNEMGTDLSETRNAFRELTEKLVGKLSQETLKKTSVDLRAKAQVAIDILIRNLFERTADIGFLATDEDIREFIKSGAADPTALRERFREYVAKYSVYSNVVLLGCDGTVLAQLDESNPVKTSADPLIAEALNTTNDFVEVSRHSDLEPRQSQSLIYAYRVTEANNSHSARLGVLCLVFKFQNEMEGIFQNLLDPGDWSVLSIVEPDGRVIASSDIDQVRIGSRVECVVDGDYSISRYAGRLYLAKTCPTHGYQGFLGLGWLGHVMIPLDQAFQSTDSLSYFDMLDQRQRSSIEECSSLFSAALRAIPNQAEQIQRELECTVWNGNVRDTNPASKVLLHNISVAGKKSKEVFNESIGNLYATIVSSRLKDVKFQAALGTDIMDRNLYERANDCRWWALNSEFRRILGGSEVSDSDRVVATKILQYINGLYTVYTNLFLYDRSGTIVAVSNPEQSNWVGHKLTESWVPETVAIRNTQDYRVSGFTSTELYADRPTYIYNAATRSPIDPSRTTGGIGIVFDSEPQFRSMLEDTLPRGSNGEIPEGYFAVFADRSRQVIACSNEAFAPCTTIDIPQKYFDLPHGRSLSEVIEYDDQFYALGVCSASGYREYKVQDSYRNDVTCLVFAPLAPAADGPARNGQKDLALEPGFFRPRRSNEASEEIATFYLGRQCFGLNIKHVSEAIRVDSIIPIPRSPSFVSGIVVHKGKSSVAIDPRPLLMLEDAHSRPQSCAVLIKQGSKLVGLLVDALGENPQVAEEQITRSGALLDTPNTYLEGIILSAASETAQTVMILDPDRFLAHLSGGQDIASWGNNGHF